MIDLEKVYWYGNRTFGPKVLQTLKKLGYKVGADFLGSDDILKYFVRSNVLCCCTCYHDNSLECVDIKEVLKELEFRLKKVYWRGDEEKWNYLADVLESLGYAIIWNMTDCSSFYYIDFKDLRVKRASSLKYVPEGYQFVDSMDEVATIFENFDKPKITLKSDHEYKMSRGFTKVYAEGYNKYTVEAMKEFYPNLVYNPNEDNSNRVIIVCGNTLNIVHFTEEIFMKTLVPEHYTRIFPKVGATMEDYKNGVLDTFHPRFIKDGFTENSKYVILDTRGNLEAIDEVPENYCLILKNKEKMSNYLKNEFSMCEENSKKKGLFSGMMAKYTGQFVPRKEEGLRISNTGLIVVPQGGEYIGIDQNNELISFNEQLCFDFPVYSINKPAAQIVEGDTIKDGNTFGKVVAKKKDGSFSILSYTGSTRNKKVIKDFILNSSFVTVIVNMFSNFGGTGMNPMMMMMMDENKDFNMKDMMMMQMMQGNNQNAINPMMLMLMSKDKDGDKDSMMETMMMMSMMNGNNNPFNFGNAQTAAAHTDTQTAEAPSTPTE